MNTKYFGLIGQISSKSELITRFEGLASRQGYSSIDDVIVQLTSSPPMSPEFAKEQPALAEIIGVLTAVTIAVERPDPKS